MVGGILDLSSSNEAAPNAASATAGRQVSVVAAANGHEGSVGGSPPADTSRTISQAVKVYQRRIQSANTEHRKKPRGGGAGPSRSLGKRKRLSISSAASAHSSDSDDGYEEYYFYQVLNRRRERLNRVLQELSPMQQEDVRDIGFGGLLHFSTAAVPDQMNQWLVDCFDPVKRYFHCDGQIRFSVTAEDARMVFGLPVNPEKKVVIQSANHEVRMVKQRWRDYYGLRFTTRLHLREVESMILKQPQGGVDFKRFFVLYVMNTLLTPKFGKEIGLGLLNYLWDVDNIKSYDWVGHVVDHLCTRVYKFKVREAKEASSFGRGCEGCLILLQLIYFHSTIWPGKPLPNDQPYIKHWGGDSIGVRVFEEMRSMGFGKLLFKDKCAGEFDSGRLLVKPFCNGEEGSSEDISVLTAEDIGESLKEGNKRKAWLILKDVDQTLDEHAKYMDVVTRPLKVCSFRLNPEGKAKFDVGFGYDTVVSKLHTLCNGLSNEVGIGRPSPLQHTLYGQPNPVVEPLDERFPHDQMSNCPWTTWTFNYPPTYINYSVQSLCRISHKFEPYKMKIADYCLGDGQQAEILFVKKGEDQWLRTELCRADMWSMGAYRNISVEVVNVFAMLLNRFWDSQRWEKRICLRAVQMDKDMFDPIMVVDQWLRWLRTCELDIPSASFVYIPILHDGNYYLVVINAVEGQIQLIETTREAPEDGHIEKLGRAVGTCFWRLLEVKKHKVVLEAYRSFSFHVLYPLWRNSLLYSDRGECVMCMMENFTGSIPSLDSLRLDVKSKRLQLRLSYLCFILLSDSNAKRKALLDRIPGFIESKAAIV